MKFLTALMLAWLAAAPFSMAAEVMESLKTRAGREYFKVEVLTSDDVGIRIRHDGGTARISYQDLPDAMQTKYHFDRKKAEAAKAEESKNQQEHDKSFTPSVTVAPKKQPFSSKAAPAPAPAKAKEAEPQKDAQEMENLEAYIAEMKATVNGKTVEAQKLRIRAQGERSKFRVVNKGYSDDGYSVSKTVPDKSGYARANQYEEDAAALDRQIAKARVLIAVAEAKRSHLAGDSSDP